MYLLNYVITFTVHLGTDGHFYAYFITLTYIYVFFCPVSISYSCSNYFINKY